MSLSWCWRDAPPPPPHALRHPPFPARPSQPARVWAEAWSPRGATGARVAGVTLPPLLLTPPTLLPWPHGPPAHPIPFPPSSDPVTAARAPPSGRGGTGVEVALASDGACLTACYSVGALAGGGAPHSPRWAAGVQATRSVVPPFPATLRVGAAVSPWPGTLLRGAWGGGAASAAALLSWGGGGGDIVRVTVTGGVGSGGVGVGVWIGLN